MLLSTLCGVMELEAELAFDNKVLGDLTALMAGWR
jgi:hypothetical protein